MTSTPARASGPPAGRRRRPGPAGRAAGLLPAATAAVLGLAGCGSSGPPAPEPASTAAPTPAAAPAGTGGTDAGDLHIRGAYIPQQASVSEAAAYFTVTNSADTPDTLTAVTTPAAPMVTLHTTVTRGGTGTMEMLSQLAIPAHGTAALTVGHDHLMLMNPVQRLTQGQRVILTLTFARAGQVELAVPVVGYTGPAGGPSSSGGVDGEGAPVEDGGAMPGMTMPAGQYMTMPAGQYMTMPAGQ